MVFSDRFGENNHDFSHARKISYITHLKQSTQWYLQIFIASLNGFRLSSCLSLWRKWITSWKKSCNLISWACLRCLERNTKIFQMVVWWWFTMLQSKKSPTKQIQALYVFPSFSNFKHSTGNQKLPTSVPKQCLKFGFLWYAFPKILILDITPKKQPQNGI